MENSKLNYGNARVRALWAIKEKHLNDRSLYSASCLNYPDLKDNAEKMIIHYNKLIKKQNIKNDKLLRDSKNENYKIKCYIRANDHTTRNGFKYTIMIQNPGQEYVEDQNFDNYLYAEWYCNNQGMTHKESLSGSRI